MCERAGFSNRYTNHSRKVTCATELFVHNVDKQLITRQTGHCSSVVRAHKRPGVAHDMLVSAILQPPKKSKLDDEQCVLPSLPNCESLGECSKQLPQGVDPLLKRQVWNSPFQMGMEKPHIDSSKENYPSPHNLPVVLTLDDVTETCVQPYPF